MTECYFITGTDTEVGKTVASTALLQVAKRNGLVTAGYKPVASGSNITSVGLRNRDALLLQHNSSLVLPYELVNPYTFIEPTSPHIASVSEGQPIKFNRLTQGLHKLKNLAEFVLIEGAGGWFTPLTLTKTFADWVIQEQLSVILVVGIKLGCINHTILTTRVIIQSGLRLSGWIANNLMKLSSRHAEYMLTLKSMMVGIPFLGEIPYLAKDIKESETWKYINFSELHSI